MMQAEDGNADNGVEADTSAVVTVDAGVNVNADVNDISQLAALLGERQKKLREAKRLARRVLQQRADVESFLNESVQVCQDQVVREQKHKKRLERREMLRAHQVQQAAT